MANTSIQSPNTTVAQITTANSYFNTGATIRSSQIIYLSQLIRTVSNHTHTLTDYSTIHNYGNTGATASTTDTVSPTTTITTLVSAPIGSAIQASDFNKLRTDIGQIRSHNHAWTDN